MSSTQSSLKLYLGVGCPYCSKVMHFIQEHGIELPTVDVWSDDAALAELMQLMDGRRQVPCLSIDGVGLLESDDIIQHLQRVFVA